MLIVRLGTLREAQTVDPDAWRFAFLEEPAVMDMKSLVMLGAQVSLVMIVTSVGLLAQWREVLRVMSDWRLVARSVIAVNVVVPATAVIMCSLLPVEQPVKIGIALMAISPLAPILSARLAKAGVDASFAVGLDFVLVLISIIVVPATLALLSAIFPVTASISPYAVGKIATMAVLAPLVVGMTINAVARGFARQLSTILLIAGFVGILVVALFIIYARIGAIVTLVGDGTLLAIATTIAAGIVAGHVLGGPEPTTRLTVALAAGLRFPGLAVLIAKDNFESQQILSAIALYLLTAMVMSLIYQVWMERRQRAGPA